MGTAFISEVESRLPRVAAMFDRYHVSALMKKGYIDHAIALLNMAYFKLRIDIDILN